MTRERLKMVWNDSSEPEDFVVGSALTWCLKISSRNGCEDFGGFLARDHMGAHEEMGLLAHLVFVGGHLHVELTEGGGQKV